MLGPGSLTVSTKLGAGFGFNLLWVILLAMVFMIAFTRMSSLIGLVSDRSLIQTIQKRFGRVSALVIGLGIFLASASFQAGNSIGAGVAFAELSGTSPKPWIIFFTGTAILLLFSRSFYKILEKLMIGLVLLMLSAFILTVIMSNPSLPDIGLGFIPSIPSGSELLVIALTASTFSIGGAFYQSYLVREKGFQKEDADACINESRNGILLLGFLTSLVLVCAATVLHHSGIEVNTASDLGLALEPLFGRFTSSAFMIGFFAASYSSLIGNATIGGAILADTLNLGHQLQSRNVRYMIIMVMIVGASIALVFGAIPLQLIILAQGVTIIVVPAAALGILLIANSKEMGSLKNSLAVNLIGFLGLGLLLVLAVYNVNKLLF